MYIRGDREALYFAVLYLIRRILFAIAVCFIPQFYSGQVYTFLFFTMLMIHALFKHKPFSVVDPRLNKFALGNEVFLFIAGLSLMPMSNLVREPEYRWTVGYFFIGIALAFIAYNVIVLCAMGIVFFRQYVKNKK